MKFTINKKLNHDSGLTNCVREFLSFRKGGVVKLEGGGLSNYIPGSDIALSSKSVNFIPFGQTDTNTENNLPRYQDHYLDTGIEFDSYIADQPYLAQTQVVTLQPQIIYQSNPGYFSGSTNTSTNANTPISTNTPTTDTSSVKGESFTRTGIGALTFRQMLEKYGEGIMEVANWHLRAKDAKFGVSGSYHKRAHPTWKNPDGTPMPQAFDVHPTKGHTFSEIFKILGKPVWQEWLASNGWGICDESTAAIRKTHPWKATGDHIHIGHDSAGWKQYVSAMKKYNGQSIASKDDILKYPLATNTTQTQTVTNLNVAKTTKALNGTKLNYRNLNKFADGGSTDNTVDVVENDNTNSNYDFLPKNVSVSSPSGDIDLYIPGASKVADLTSAFIEYKGTPSLYELNKTLSNIIKQQQINKYLLNDNLSKLLMNIKNNLNNSETNKSEETKPELQTQENTTLLNTNPTEPVSVTSESGNSNTTSETPLFDKAINDNLGIPYVWGGSSKSGADCRGFTKLVFDQLGIKMDGDAESQRTKYTDPVEKKDIKKGDLVFLTGTNPKKPGNRASHVAVVTDVMENGDLIVAENNNSKTKSDNGHLWKLSDPDSYHSKHWFGAGRVKGFLIGRKGMKFQYGGSILDNMRYQLDPDNYVTGNKLAVDFNNLYSKLTNAWLPAPQYTIQQQPQQGLIAVPGYTPPASLPGSNNPTSSGSTPKGTTVSGNLNLSNANLNTLEGRLNYIVNYFKNKGVSSAGAIALAAIATNESGCKTTDFEPTEKANKSNVKSTQNGGYGVGIFQWTGVKSKNRALLAAGFDPSKTKIEDLNMEQLCDMMYKEWNARDPEKWKALSQCNDLQQAVRIVYNCMIAACQPLSKATEEECQKRSQIYARQHALMGYTKAGKLNGYEKRLNTANKILQRLQSANLTKV